MKKTIILLALAAILVSACGANNATVIPNASLATAMVAPTATVPQPTAAPTATQPPSATPAPSDTPTATSGPLFPPVSFSRKVTCRLGPDDHYTPVNTFNAADTSKAEGRNQDGTYLLVDSMIKNHSSTCWVPTASVVDFGGVSHLLVAQYPALPVGPTVASINKPVCGKLNRQGDPLMVSWGSNVSGVGYRIFRNGVNIASVYGDHYYDHDTPGSHTPYTYTYTIQAYNAAGVSIQTASVSITLCD